MTKDGGPIKQSLGGRELGPEKITPFRGTLKDAHDHADALLDRFREPLPEFDPTIERTCKPDIDRLWTVEDIPSLKAVGIPYEIIGDLEEYIKRAISVDDETPALIFAPHRWGWRELHSLSFGAGFLLSSLFWLTIGIALQIISR